MNDITFINAQQAKAINSFKNTKEKLCMTEVYIYTCWTYERLLLITSLKMVPWCAKLVGVGT